jgi:hypothetical protein
MHRVAGHGVVGTGQWLGQTKAEGAGWLAHRSTSAPTPPHGAGLRAPTCFVRALRASFVDSALLFSSLMRSRTETFTD